MVEKPITTGSDDGSSVVVESGLSEGRRHRRGGQPATGRAKTAGRSLKRKKGRIRACLISRESWREELSSVYLLKRH